MKNFMAKQVISMLVNFRYLRFKAVEIFYKENNKKISDTFDDDFRYNYFI